MKKKIISGKKKLNILTHNLVNRKSKGTYFNIKLNDPSKYISDIRNSINIENYIDLVKVFDDFPSKLAILGDKKVKTKELFQNILTYKNFDSEFFWAKFIILKNKNKINRYLEYKEKYSRYLVYGNYDDAEKTLTTIEQEFGTSIWLIKNQISFNQISKGLEEQKNITKNIKKNLKDGSLSKFLVHWLSIRNENNTTINRFRNQIDLIIPKLNPNRQDGFKEYIIYNLLENEDLSIDELIQVVRLSYSTCIIDYYEAFVSLLKALAFNSDNTNNYYKAKNFIINSISLFKDFRLNNIALIFNNVYALEVYDKESSSTYDFLLKGKFQSAFYYSRIALIDRSNIPINIILHTYSKVFLKNVDNDKHFAKNSLLSLIINNLSQVLSRGVVSASKEYSELNKILINFSGFTWTVPIKLILAKEVSKLENNIEGLEKEIINLETIHPIILEYINDNNLALLYEQKNNKIYGNTLGLLAHQSLKHLKIFNNINASKQFEYYINSIICFKSGNFIDSIAYAEKLKLIGIDFNIRKANSLISYSYLKIQNYKKACEIVVEIYLEDKNQHSLLPLEELSQIITHGSEVWDNCKYSLDLSILLDACLKYVNKTTNYVKLITNNRRFAYEDFLTSQNIEKPSQLNLNNTILDQKKLIYYLRNICLESIMDLSGTFSSSSEVLEERLKICRLLSEYDFKNEIIYKNEISEIVRRQVITNRRKEVDQSRVYVDIKNIRDWAEVELEESFYRYISYLKSGLDNKSDSRKKIDRTSVIYTPDDEVNELFIYMVEEIKSAYLSSDLGLDRFISTRIRHGELERTIRIPIQKHHLITKKNSKNSPYLSNDYWLSKLNEGGDSRKKIDLAFKRFSEDYDNMISIITGEWLQINTQEKPEGLFDFNLTKLHINRLINSVDSHTSLKQFIDIVIASLENVLVLVLVNIRNELNGVGKENAKNLLNKLNDEILETLTSSNIELNRAINQARTELTLQFDKLSEWFVPSTEGNSAPYTIEDAVLVAETIIKEANSDFTVEMSQKSDRNYSIHGQLPIFTDVFMNIFENVVKRSGLKYPIAKIETDFIDIDDDHFELQMNISNDLGEEIDIKSVKETLNIIREKLDKNNYSKDVARENNSGLIKIFKSINDFSVIDSNLIASLEFDIINKRFEMDIKVPFKIIRIDHPSLE